MFEGLKTAAEVLKLVADLKNIDADKDGKPDLQEFLADGAVLAVEVAEAKAANEKVIARINKMGALAGTDIALIRDKFGLKEVVPDAS